jgi:2'-5' RNA ligase
MHRLFVAIRPPTAIRAHLLRIMGGVSGARWQTDDQLHLTLRFIGEVDRHRARDIKAALSSVHHAAFHTALTGVHVFERCGEPAMLWAGAAPQEPLKSLHKKIDRALGGVGVEFDRRAYLPHVTLARLPRGSGSVRGFLESTGGFATEPFLVDEFCLLESRLTPEGAVYTAAERYSLD